jgi:hypothetical protein
MKVRRRRLRDGAGETATAAFGLEASGRVAPRASTTGPWSGVELVVERGVGRTIAAVIRRRGGRGVSALTDGVESDVVEEDVERVADGRVAAVVRPPRFSARVTWAAISGYSWK